MDILHAHKIILSWFDLYSYNIRFCAVVTVGGTVCLRFVRIGLPAVFHKNQRNRVGSVFSKPGVEFIFLNKNF
jgi:hypothetical protein